VERYHKNEVEERRLHTRFPMKDWRAIAALGPKPVTLGKILDISESGLSLEFLPDIGPKNVDPKEVHIYVIGEDFFIQGLECRCVYAENVESPDFSMIQTKRCGIEFQALKEKQLSKLEDLITYHV
jgi:PilZ domain